LAARIERSAGDHRCAGRHLAPSHGATRDRTSRDCSTTSADHSHLDARAEPLEEPCDLALAAGDEGAVVDEGLLLRLTGVEDGSCACLRRLEDELAFVLAWFIARPVQPADLALA
jgi:hypothetical protein